MSLTLVQRWKFYNNQSHILCLGWRRSMAMSELIARALHSCVSLNLISFFFGQFPLVVEQWINIYMDPNKSVRPASFANQSWESRRARTSLGIFLLVAVVVEFFMTEQTIDVIIEANWNPNRLGSMTRSMGHDNSLTSTITTTTTATSQRAARWIHVVESLVSKSRIKIYPVFSRRIE